MKLLKNLLEIEGTYWNPLSIARIKLGPRENEGSAWRVFIISVSHTEEADSGQVITLMTAAAAKTYLANLVEDWNDALARYMPKDSSRKT